VSAPPVPQLLPVHTQVDSSEQAQGVQRLNKERHDATLGAGGQVGWEKQEEGNKVRRKALKNLLRKDKDGFER
jgi:hypothetical protein